MSRPERIEATVETLVKGGDGLARVDNEVWFIPGTAPGDRVLCHPIEKGTNYTRAIMDKLIVPSASRVSPACPQASRCGGCPWMHIGLEAQREAKLRIVRELFTRALPRENSGSLAAAEALLLRTVDGDGLCWRNRFQFHRPADSDLALAPAGLMDHSGQRVIPLTDCPIAHPAIRRALAEKQLRAPLSSNRFTVFADDEVFLCEGGKEEGLVRVRGKTIRMRADLFFQSTIPMLERLVDDLLPVLERADRHREALDLYAGVGTFSVFLKDHFPSLCLMEREKGSLALARENLKGCRASFQAASDDEWAKANGKLSRTREAGFAIVDPPRAGLSSRMRSWLEESAIPLVAYVSCDPASLARDTASLVAAGYVLSKLCIYEFYPHSPHIESLAILQRRP